MNSRIVLLLALAAWTLPCTAGEVEGFFECSYEVKGRCTYGSAIIEMKNGQAQNFIFGNYFCGTEDRWGDSCHLESTRGTGTDRWREYGTKTEIELGKPTNRSQRDTVLIFVERDQLRLDFTGTQSSGKCGTTAELPQWLVLERKSKKCKVRL